MKRATLEAACDDLERGEPEAALARIGPLAELARAGLDPVGGEAALCGAWALLDLGRAEQAGPWLDHATRALGADEPEVVAARAEWHLARWEGAEASALLARLEPDSETLGRRALAEHLAGRPAAAAELRARARALEAPGAAPGGNRAALHLEDAEFDAVVRAAIAALPPAFQELLESVPVLVDPAPTAALFGGVDAARASGIGPDLLGLFAGPSRLERSTSEGLDEPARVYLFRHNLEALARSAEELEREIEITLYHELGHALGFDEEGVDGLGLA